MTKEIPKDCLQCRQHFVVDTSRCVISARSILVDEIANYDLASLLNQFAAEQYDLLLAKELSMKAPGQGGSS